MTDNPFQAAWDKHKASSSTELTPEDEQRADALLADPNEEEFDFDAAQELDEMMAVLNPDRHRNVRNYAKDRTLSGKARKRARKAARA